MRAAVTAFALSVVGCVGSIPSSGEETPDAAVEKEVDRLWRESAYPVLTKAPPEGAVCADCHVAAQVDYLFLKGGNEAETRATLLASNYVNMETPASSRILTKGEHSGRALDANQTFALLSWLTAEREAASGTGGDTDVELKTAAITVTTCTAGQLLTACTPNTLSLTGIEGVPLDASITFKAPPLSGMLYVNELTIHGGTTGAYIEHPLFVSVPPAGSDETTTPRIADSIDRYADTVINVAPNTDLVIEGGTAGFNGFPGTNQLEVHFKKIAAYKPETVVPPAGGCKDLASFKTNAKTPLTTNCVSCHANAANTNARGAMDITGVNTADDAMILLACNQVLTRVNKTVPASSGLFGAPTPGNTTHPFNFNGNQASFTAFRTAVTLWITAEATAP